MKRIINVGKKGGSTSGTYSLWSGMLKRYSKKKTFIKQEWVVKILILDIYRKEAVEKKALGFLCVHKLLRSLHHFATVAEWSKRDK